VRPRKLALPQRVPSGHSDWPRDATRELNGGKADARLQRLLAGSVSFGRCPTATIGRTRSWRRVSASRRTCEFTLPAMSCRSPDRGECRVQT